MSTIGYGDIHAITIRERMFCMLAMIVAAGVYAYNLNYISGKISAYNKLATKFREHMLYVNTWMMTNHLPKTLKN